MRCTEERVSRSHCLDAGWKRKGGPWSEGAVVRLVLLRLLLTLSRRRVASSEVAADGGDVGRELRLLRILGQGAGDHIGLHRLSDNFRPSSLGGVLDLRAKQIEPFAEKPI